MEKELQQAMAATAADQHGVLSLKQLKELGVGERLRRSWLNREVLIRVGPRSFVTPGSAATWLRNLWCAHFDIEGYGYIAGRSAARLHGLDNFTSDDVELIVPRSRRGLAVPWTLHSTDQSLDNGDTLTVDGLRCLSPQRLILDGPLFGFTKDEISNAIDSAIRLKKVSEQRLRTAVTARQGRAINGGRILLDALVDTGGESRLERRFLTLLRRSGIERPTLQRVYRSDTGRVARVDAVFADGLIVELEGHAKHSSRSQRSADERRRTELQLRGNQVIVFTYDHVTYQSEYVMETLTAARAGRTA